MYFIYVDESGTGLADRRTSIFTLGAILVADRDLEVLDREVQALKRRIIPYAKPEDWEIKARDIRHGEKLIKGMNWEERKSIFRQITDLIVRLKLPLWVVQVDKRDLPEFVETDTDLYRLAFTKLLSLLQVELGLREEIGTVILDARSDLHSSVQDRRLIDAFCDWRLSQEGKVRLVSLPLFGFSAFYPGLQLADFVSYIAASAANERRRPERDSITSECYRKLEKLLSYGSIPSTRQR
ncbi:MAG: hypothetical protein KatS3mg053_2767 [Candidatus Roseilinea sp.]|nr:MAG: hypothetical protein KatS3mg053_2767 [Candidatus Roseilinea sp.]